VSDARDGISVFERIQHQFGGLSGARRRLARHLIDHWDQAAFLSATQLGEAAGVSETVVIRFAGLLGYDGYPELKADLQDVVRRRLDTVMVRRLESVSRTSEPAELVRLVLEDDAENIRSILQHNTVETLVGAAEAILGAAHVYVLGMRSSAGPAQLLSVNLSQALRNAHFVTLDIGTMIDQLRTMTAEDLLVTFSFTRYSPYAEGAARFSRTIGCKHLAITDDRLSPTARLADITLLATTRSLWFGHSHSATVSLINILLSLVGRLGEARVRRSLGELEELLATNPLAPAGGAGGPEADTGTKGKGR